MAYKVVLSDDVAAEAARFSDEALRYWNVCLSEIASNPLPRSAFYVERIVPILNFPMRTYLYEITEETSISGEQMLVFVAEFFPEHSIVYVMDEDAREVRVIYLRQTRW